MSTIWQIIAGRTMPLSGASPRRSLSSVDKTTFEGILTSKSAGGNTAKQHAGNAALKHIVFIHIPKTGGDSFMKDSPRHMAKGQTLKGNHEKSFLYSASNEMNDDPGIQAMVMLRNPLAHVLSQFLECKYDDWGQIVTNHTDFPGYGQFYSVLAGFDSWIEHFVTNAEKYGESHAYNCYDPWNMQTRYMAVKDDLNAHYPTTQEGRFPSLTKAQASLRNPRLIVGILEHYAASLCLLEYHALQGQLSEAC